MIEGGIRVGPTVFRLRRVLVKGSVNLVEILGGGVIRLQIVIAERPPPGCAVVVFGLLEVAAPKSWQASTGQLRVGPGPGAEARLERPAGVRPGPRGRG